MLLNHFICLYKTGGFGASRRWKTNHFGRSSYRIWLFGWKLYTTGLFERGFYIIVNWHLLLNVVMTSGSKNWHFLTLHNLTPLPEI